MIEDSSANRATMTNGNQDRPLNAEAAARPLLRHEYWIEWSRYAWLHRRAQIVITCLALIVLVVGMIRWESLRPPFGGNRHPSSAVTTASGPGSAVAPIAARGGLLDWIGWFGQLQSIFGGFTLLVALFVWGDDLREDWEADLPKRMNVYFFYRGQPVIVCRHVWVAGENDLRAWGQQVAAQAVNERFLDFDANLASRPGSVVVLPGPKGVVCKLYSIRFVLTQLPKLLSNRGQECRYQNLAENSVARNEPVDEVAQLPDVAEWMKAGREFR